MSFDQQNKPFDTENEDALSSFELVNEAPVKNKNTFLAALNTQKGILILSIIGILLIGSIALILTDPFHWFPEEEVEDPNSDVTEVEDHSVTILDKTKKNTVVVNRVEVTNKEDSFTILYNEKEGLYYLDGYTDILLSVDMTNLLQENTGKLIAIDTISKADNLKDFGLDKPEATATVTYTDGSQAVIYVGNATPSKDGYYVRTSQDDKVYIFDTDAVQLFTYAKTAYVDVNLITPPTVKSDDENGKAVLKEITYTGKNYPNSLVMRRSHLTDSEELALFSYIIEKPYPRGTNDATLNALSSFTSLYAEQALILHPTEKEKEALGFNNPLAVITATLAAETGDQSNEDESDDIVYYNSITTTITIGSSDNQDYIVMVDGIDAIFVVEKSVFSTIADRTYENSVSTLLFLKNIVEIGKISVTTGGKTYDFVLEHFPNKEDNDAKLKVTVNGEVHDTLNFRELYQILMSMERYDETDASPSGEPELAIKAYYTDGSLYIGTEYYPLDANQCLTKTTEGEVYITRMAHVSHFIDQLNNYLNDETVIVMN